MRSFARLLFLLLAPLTGIAPAAQAAPGHYHLLVGTYTSGKSLGLYLYQFDSGTGHVDGPLRVTQTPNPSYLSFSRDGHTLFAVNENGRGTQGDSIGRATSFAFDPVSGALQQISQAKTLGDHPTYSSVSPDGRYLFVANYSVQPEGSLAVLPIQPGGVLGPVVQLEAHQASHVNSERQASGHVHSAVMSPKGDFLFAPDLGADKVFVYRYQADNPERPLLPANPAFVPVPAGSGPRHLVFSADGRYAYLTLELSGQVMAFSVEGGQLHQLQTYTLAPPGFKGKVGAGALHLSADGRFLYVVNRGDDNHLVAFSVDASSGLLDFVERQPVQGREPREFAIAPGGRFVLVANQNSDQIRVFARDPQSGKLGKLLQTLEVGAPADLRFVAIP
ncbi:MAG: 6-phosphogluconolactonase [Pseudomonas citronellolis]|nr:MAG: 6-phosphogluconolactonase [Pseudomonas citronellolis]